MKNISSKDHFHNLVKVNENLNIGAAEYYQQLGLTYVDVPSIVGITGACENIDTLFNVKSRVNTPLFFTQTGQLSLEQSLQSLSGVYTVITSGRDEEEEDERHLRQFRLTEEEFDCTMAGMDKKDYNEENMFNALLTHIQGTVVAIITRVLKHNKKALERYGRDVEQLERALKKNFLRIPYEDAILLLQKNGYPKIKFGDDLKAKQEAKIVELLNKKGEELPVFITKYPKEIKFFNMKVSERDPRVVLSADLVFPYAGEGTGAAVREHNFARLKNRLLGSKMFEIHKKRGGTIDDFKWYFDIIESEATNPHAGYGIGNERVLQYIFGAKDIRSVSLFALLGKQTG